MWYYLGGGRYVWRIEYTRPTAAADESGSSSDDSASLSDSSAESDALADDLLPGLKREIDDLHIKPGTVPGPRSWFGWRPAAGVAARLIIEGRGEPHVLKDGTTILGSDSGCDIVLEDEYVSGRHARVESIRSQSGWRFLLTDLGSTNGTWVEGVEEPVDQRELDDSDVILIGELRLRIEILPDSA